MSRSSLASQQASAIRPSTARVWLELCLVAIILLASYGVASTHDIWESIDHFIHTHEALEVDELIVTACFASFVLAVFSFRRLMDLRREVKLRDRTEHRIAHLAHHDELTDLPNRAALRSRLAAAIARARRTGEIVAVHCMDLDRFKPINDMLGHSAGDVVLREVAKRLGEQARGYDMVARLGGDEFAIVQPGLDSSVAALRLAERLVDVVGQPLTIDGVEVQVGLSCGIACYPGDAVDEEGLLRLADIALYRSKATGRNRVSMFEPGMDAQVRERRQLEQELRTALQEEGQLRLEYQPLFNLETNQIVAFEALIRWSHPTRGEMSPAEFVSLAEEAGLIGALGAWVLHRACADAAAWPNQEVGVAVNLSPLQFKSGDILAVVRSALAASGLSPARLELEITEGVLMEDTPATLELLRQLHEFGLRIAMDDFGSGYSSLSYLRSFRFDKLKIDRSFITDLGTSADARAVVDAIIVLGRSLGMTATAEGVETTEQLQPLAAMRCHEAQGFHLGRPMSTEKVVALLADPAGMVAVPPTSPRLAETRVQ